MQRWLETEPGRFYFGRLLVSMVHAVYPLGSLAHTHTHLRSSLPSRNLPLPPYPDNQLRQSLPEP